MRLAGTGVVTAVEKRKEAITSAECAITVALLCLGSSGSFICLNAGECGLKVRLFEDMSLGLELCRSKNEVLRNNSKLVQHKIVGRSKICDLKSGKWVLKRVKGLLRLGEVLGRRFWFVCQGRREAKLELVFLSVAVL